MGILTYLGKIFDAARFSLSELRKSSKYEHSQKGDILCVYPNGLGEWYPGLNDEQNNLLFSPHMQRVFRKPYPIEVPGQGKYWITSAENHDTCNITAYGRFAQTIKTDAVLRMRVKGNLAKILHLRWLYPEDVIEFKLTGMITTINPTLYDNKYSHRFSGSSYQFVQTKIMSFLEDVGRTRFLLSCGLVGAICLFLGVIIGVVLSKMV